MTETIRHYVELRFSGCTFLLPNVPNLLVEPYENMRVEPHGKVGAYRSVQGAHWPAFSLNAALQPVLGVPWTRAVFLTTTGRPVGLLVEDLKLVPTDSLRLEPYMPLGPQPLGSVHVFDKAAMHARGLTLVFSPSGLAAYLLAQENTDDGH